MFTGFWQVKNGHICLVNQPYAIYKLIFQWFFGKSSLDLSAFGLFGTKPSEMFSVYESFLHQI